MAGRKDGQILVWYLGKEIPEKWGQWQVHSPEGSIYEIAFSPDGQEFVTASEDKTAAIVQFPSGEIRQLLKGHAQRIWTVGLAPGRIARSDRIRGQVSPPAYGIRKPA